MLKVLIADDHELFREGLTHLVQRLDDEVEVVECGDYRVSVEMASKRGPFDIILLDLKMPGMEEYSGIQAVKAAAPNSAVVVISAFENRHFIERSIEAGASGFVPKSSPTPVMLSALKLIQLGEIYVPSSLMYGQSGLPDRGTATYFHPAGESAQARLDLLTKRQRDVLSLIGEGKSNRDISVALKISEGTVKVHVGAILKTLDVSNRTQAALLAIDLGLASPQLSRTTTIDTS